MTQPPEAPIGSEPTVSTAEEKRMIAECVMQEIRIYGILTNIIAGKDGAAAEICIATEIRRRVNEFSQVNDINREEIIEQVRLIMQL